MDLQISVYQYANANQFLKDAWAFKKKKNPAFSLRSWAKQMGLKEHTPLHLMLNGKRTVAKKYLPVFVKSLNLNPKEGLFLENLIELGRSKNPFQKEFYLDRLNDLSPKHKIKVCELENFKYLSDPVHMLLRELVDTPGFSEDERWLQKKIRVQTNAPQIRDTLNRLIEMGLLFRDENGKLKKKDGHVSSTKDIENRAIKDYHEKSLDYAKKAIHGQSVEERELNSYLLNINRKNIPLAKQMIRDFIQRFIAKMESSAGSDVETYQLSNQFIALTREANSIKEDEI